MAVKRKAREPRKAREAGTAKKPKKATKPKNTVKAQMAAKVKESLEAKEKCSCDKGTCSNGTCDEDAQKSVFDIVTSLCGTTSDATMCSGLAVDEAGIKKADDYFDNKYHSKGVGKGGIKGKTYDKIIVDEAVTIENANEMFDKHSNGTSDGPTSPPEPISKDDVSVKAKASSVSAEVVEVLKASGKMHNESGVIEATTKVTRDVNSGGETLTQTVAELPDLNATVPCTVPKPTAYVSSRSMFKRNLGGSSYSSVSGEVYVSLPCDPVDAEETLKKAVEMSDRLNKQRHEEVLAEMKAMKA